MVLVGTEFRRSGPKSVKRGGNPRREGRLRQLLCELQRHFLRREHDSGEGRDRRDQPHVPNRREGRRDPDEYFDGSSAGDNEDLFSGENQDKVRWTGQIGWGGKPTAVPIVPWQDTPGWPGDGTAYFGSAHPNGFFMALCDGSVRLIAYNSLDPYIWMYMGNRHDNHVIANQW